MLTDTILKLLKLDGLLNSLTDYVETRIELLKYEIKEDVARAIAKASIFLVLALFTGLIIIFLSVAIALKIGDHLGHAAGFGIVSGAYLLLTLIILLLRRRIRQAIEDDIKKNFKR